MDNEQCQIRQKKKKNKKKNGKRATVPKRGCRLVSKPHHTHTTPSSYSGKELLLGQMETHLKEAG